VKPLLAISVPGQMARLVQRRVADERLRLQHVDVHEVQRGERSQQRVVGLARVGLPDPVELVAGREADGDAALADRGGDGVRGLHDEADAPHDVRAVAVLAQVGVRAEELVQQVPVGGVQLDAVGACVDRAARGLHVRVAHLGELGGRDLARRDVLQRPGGGDDRAFVAQGGRRDRRDAAGEHRVRNAAAVHELDDELRVPRRPHSVIRIAALARCA
jgi:hypothetical protein